MCTIRSAGAGAAGVLLLVAVSLVLSATPTAGQLKQNHGFNQQQQSPAEPAPQRYSEKVLLVSDSVTNLAQRIARAISSQKSKTEIFSPVSIAGAMSLLLLGSAGQTQKELLRVMGLEQTGISFKDIHMGFGRLFEDLVSNEASLEPLVHWRRNDKCNRVDEEEDEDDDYPPPPGSSANELPAGSKQHLITLANGLFVQNGYNLSRWYRQASMKLYQSEVQSLNFAEDTAGSTSYINRWVSEKTHDKIPKILSSQLAPATTLVLASALYFRALWHKTFIEGATKPREFYPDGREHPPIMVDMMGHGGCFPYYESPELDARIVGVPYKRGLTTMYVIMPNDSNRAKVLALMAKLNSGNLNNLIDNMTMKTAIILFPKMHISNMLDLKRVLQMLGTRSLFSSSYSNLTGMVTELWNGDEFTNRYQEDLQFAAPEPRPTVNIPPYIMHPTPSMEGAIVFPRIQPNDTSDDELMLMTTDSVPATDVPAETTTTTTTSPERGGRGKRGVSYKVPSSKQTQQVPLRSKDFILNKRIIKENGPVGKKGLRRRTKRNTASTPDQLLYVSNAVHQVDLEINEKGTEGGAATIITLNRSGTSVVFRADAPFVLLIRNDRTRMPLFYGAVFDPTS
uniref:Serpin domain-containing protein n=1 Tax=Anopheles darlingi TaxID=43151 RepID=A0A675B3V0_ANODA